MHGSAILFTPLLFGLEKLYSKRAILTPHPIPSQSFVEVAVEVFCLKLTSMHFGPMGVQLLYSACNV